MPETESLSAELDRRASASARVLAALQEGPRSSAELNAICYRYGARLMELRRRGWPIRSTRAEGPLWRYELTGPRGGPEKAEDVPAEVPETCPTCGKPLGEEGDAP